MGAQGRTPRQQKHEEQKPGEGSKLGLYDRRNETCVAEGCRETRRVEKEKDRAPGLA